MSASSSDLLSALDALSPVDGRYRAASAPLRGLLSEGGLIRERIRVEAQWLLHLAAAVPQLPGAQFTPAVRERARQLASAPEPAAAAAVKAIEQRINHDVKAVEYYVREQLAAVGAADWPAVAQAFVTSLALEYNPWTTQIEPHDWIGEYCDALAGANVVLIDLSRDLWGYISLGYLRQRALAGEVGSSTMPHKVNPIDFENAEGNCGVANALLRHFADKLPVSRWQRDLSDSTVLRNLGVALGHALIAWSALGRGLTKIEADSERMAADLAATREVLGEALQTVLRAAGVPGGYERLKEFTRGRTIDAATLAAFIDTLPLAPAEKTRLRALEPADYTGLAAQLARRI